MTGSRTRSKAATINDVAAFVGVSRQTVTRAMNNMPGISNDTKERVLAAAQELHYRPSRFGRGLVKREHRTLGLVIDDLANPYYPELASAVVGFAATHGWNVVLSDTVHAEDRSELLRDLAQQVDAVVGYVDFSGTEAHAGLAGLPVVQIDPGAAVPGRGAIALDYDQAMDDAVEHLLTRGARHPVMVDVSPEGQPSRRARLFVEAMRRRRIEVPVMHAQEIGLASAIEVAERTLTTRPETDAMMTFNDMTAFGVLKALRLSGIDVPGQVKVIGIDGLTFGTFVTPQLTTVALDMKEVARAAVELGVGLSSGTIKATGRGAHRTIVHRLVVREST